MKTRLGTTNIKILVAVFIAIAIGVVAIVKLDTTGKKGSGLGEEFTYDLEKLGIIDPNLILYKEPAPAIDTGFSESQSIAVAPDGSIYIAGDKAIRFFAESGNLLGEIKLADMPMCLTVAGDGKIYVGMKDHVEIYDGQGKRLATWQNLGNDAVLTSIDVSKNDVFVADAGNRIVYHFNTTGNLINRIGGKDKDKKISGFFIPSPHFDLAIGNDGLLRVANPGNHRIEAYTSEGDLEFSWGTFSNVNIEGFCGCCNPVNFAILADKSFVTCEKGLVRVKIYDQDGVFTGVVAGSKQLTGKAGRICSTPAECQSRAFDVAVDAHERIFVLDTNKNVVRIFTKIKEE
ncbi:MAG: NHL repeat-containing protein [Phycisphaerae bacterium]|nr:NHL repeat-containing protein [Phycisphaerae bacterium]